MTPFDLTDATVLLRAPTGHDIDRIATLCQHPDIARWTTVPDPYRRADAEWFVHEMVNDGWATGKTATWGVRDPVDETVHGMVSIDLQGHGEVGYWLGPAARGKGWMTAAVRLAVVAAFERGVDHARWKAIVGNTSSWRVAERVGFRRDGTVRREVEQRGVWRDAWVATLLPDELRPAEPAVATRPGPS